MTNKQRKQHTIKQQVMKLTMEFVDKGHNLVEARRLAEAKQLNHYIGAGRSNIAPKLHPCAGN